MSYESEKLREDRLRRGLRQFDYRLQKTPSRHWTRDHYGPGYMVVDDRNLVIIGCAVREFDATIDDVENLLSDMLRDEGRRQVSANGAAMESPALRHQRVNR